MIRLLITGANSYVGIEFEKYLSNSTSGKYTIDTVDMISDEWKNTDFSKYDVVFHVAAIVHSPNAPAELFYKVNRDLAIEVGTTAKSCGVKQFVLMSSMNVFGLDVGVIDENTALKPVSDYGKSKLEADIELYRLNDETFNVAIIRAPMIYGKGCKGNYNRMEKFALKSPVFPSINNKRDMIYIGNLVDYLKYVLENNVSGILYPKDPQRVCTAEMVKLIAKANNHNIYFWKIFNPFIKLLMTDKNIFALVFGDNYCEINDSFEWNAPYDLSRAVQEIYHLKNQGNMK